PPSPPPRSVVTPISRRPVRHPGAVQDRPPLPTFGRDSTDLAAGELNLEHPSRDIETVKPIPGGDEDLSHGWPKTLRDAYRGTLLTCIAGRSSCQVWVVSTPNSPWLSSSIPAVKKSELVGP